MMIETKQYIRKPFEVDAVQVTADNMTEVAEWCQGDVRKQAGDKPYIKVRVLRALTDRQTQAFVGDWILYAGTGFKVYTDKAFDKSFQLKPGSVTVTSTSGVQIQAAGGGVGGYNGAFPSSVPEQRKPTDSE